MLSITLAIFVMSLVAVLLSLINNKVCFVLACLLLIPIVVGVALLVILLHGGTIHL